MHNVSAVCAPEIDLALASRGSGGPGGLPWQELEFVQLPPPPVQKLRGE